MGVEVPGSQGGIILCWFLRLVVGGTGLSGGSTNQPLGFSSPHRANSHRLPHHIAPGHPRGEVPQPLPKLPPMLPLGPTILPRWGRSGETGSFERATDWPRRSGGPGKSMERKRIVSTELGDLSPLSLRWEFTGQRETGCWRSDSTGLVAAARWSGAP